jgi:N-acetylneuraminic acid mutarotase
MSRGRAASALLLLAAFTAQAQGTFTPAGRLGTARSGHTATLLKDGRVLVVGGKSVNGLTPLTSVELFEPGTRTWKAAAPLAQGRALHTATLLDDGRVLVAGGAALETKDGKTRFVALASVELYEPAKNLWTQGPPLAFARNGHTATLLLNGRVLVVGGAREQRSHLNQVELFDPESGTWAPRRPLAIARWLHEAVRLSDGSVVVLGGRSNQDEGGKGPGVALASVERFDPSSGTWHPVPELSEARQRTVAVASGDTVTVLGGQTTSSATNYVERWTPGADAWALGPAHLSMASSGHSATELGQGEVLVIGGEPPNAVDTNRAQRFEPGQRRWCLAGTLDVSRKGHTATSLSDGQVLVVGGTSAGIPEASAELWKATKGACEDPPGLELGEWGEEAP